MSDEKKVTQVSGLTSLVGQKVEATFSPPSGTETFEGIRGTVTWCDSGVVGLEMEKGRRTLVFSVHSPRYITVL